MRIFKKSKRSVKTPVVEVPASIGAIDQNSRLGRKAKAPVVVAKKKRAAKKVTVKTEKTSRKALPYVIARTYSAGCFAGYMQSRKGQEIVLTNARRLWFWDGAASLSQLAQSGTTKPQSCKFPEPVDYVILTQAIEILSTTAAAKNIIEGVATWKA